VPDALIGYTGFVGGNLLRQHPFTDLYNSKNIDTIQGREFELLICSGAPAEKWKANAEPARDLEILTGLMNHLRQVRARRVVLISSVDVYPDPRGVDEASPIVPEHASAYGRHRYFLEQFVRERFDSLVVRLPGLFGPGLKKNVIFDLLHNHRLEAINTAGVFQFYDLANLWKDIQTALRHGLSLVNFSTEPVGVEELAREAFRREFVQRLPGQAAQYDMRSQHAALFGGHDSYLYDKARVLNAMREFVATELKREGAA
jgi:nucleoside-diphosphate-sugar epimerase